MVCLSRRCTPVSNRHSRRSSREHRERRVEGRPGVRVTVLLAGGALLLALAACRLVSMSPLEVDGVEIAGDRILLTFSAEPDEPRVEQAFSLAADGEYVAGRFAWSANTLHFTPHEGIRDGYDYEVFVTGEAQDVHGNAMLGDFEYRFSTRADSRRPRIDSIEPAAGERIEAKGEALRLSFSRPVDRASFYRSFSLSPDIHVAVDWSQGDRVAELRPMEALTLQREYTLRISTDLRSIENNALGEEYESRFTAGPSGEVPQLLGANAAAGGDRNSDAAGGGGPGGGGGELDGGRPGGAGSEMPGLTLYPGGQFDDLIEANGGWERDWGVELHFDRPVRGDDVEEALVFAPAVEIERRAVSGRYASTFVLMPKERLEWDRRYVVRISGTVRDETGNESELDSVAAFRSDAAGSRPLEIGPAFFLEDPPGEESGAPLVDGDELDLAAYAGDGLTGYFDIIMRPAAGAGVNRFAVVEAFSIVVENVAASFELKAVSVAPVEEPPSGEPPSGEPPAGDSVRVRLTMEISDYERSGLVTLRLDEGFADSAGNRAEVPWQLRLNQVSRP